MEWIIDRFEKKEDGKNLAIIECSGTTFELNTMFLPEDIKEGTVLVIKADENAEAAKKERAKELMDRLFKK